ncbi:hypothetical protein CFC21_045271 [Triticum aestivum]|uniref:F-box protein AT5G49610-like beta-propeller domain-containing protein n=2 Tax=Triticum aestivum TaxID=4565 RepID=A0A9R1FTR4_WHEAT|nr:uncharacterized protein LOC123073624 [Triticum aestivum]KAF7034230.1 hypothetical protein CFC21_045271 [Triticum aestivum]
MRISLRLPLDLHSLSRASAVCKPWRGIVVDHKFVHRFYARHRKPPLLGFFQHGDHEIRFTPVCLPPAPDRILPGSYSLGQRYSNSEVREVLDSRRVLLTSWVIIDGWVREEVVVYDPITSKQQHRVSIPLGFRRIGGLVNGAVFCAAAARDHVHDNRRSCPFKVVLLSHRKCKHPYACVYSSETDTWSNIISTEAPDDTPFGVSPSTLIGNALYWPAKHKGDSILQFDLGTQNLAVIKGPPGMNMDDFDNFHIIQAEDGAVGLAALSHIELQMWERKVDCPGVAIWLLQKTVSLSKLLKVPPRTEQSYESLKVVGYDEDNNVILLARHDGVYMVQPKLLQARKLNGTGSTHYCYTFTSFYPLGRTIDGGTNGADNVRMTLA